MISRSTDIRDIIGSSHVAGRYNFTDNDYLNEGADRLLELESRVIKLWFTPEPYRDYPFNSDWPQVRSLVELAQTEYFKTVFAKPFTTFILEAYAPGVPEHDFLNGLSDESSAWHTGRFYEITKYLLTEYKGSGKTFILQNWESDWILTNPQFTKEPDAKTIEGMTAWLNARQDGVDKAREEIGMDGVTVVHAAEVNLVSRAMAGKVTATNNILPYTHCDLYSYSAYDTMIDEPDKFRNALDYLAEKAPASALYGDQNVFVGEFGAPENTFDQYEIVRKTVEEALDWGALYIVYWEIFCNEPAHEFQGRPNNSDMRGFWLIRPDGTKSPAWDYFHSLLSGSK